MTKLWLPTRRKLITSAAAMLAMPAIARAGTIPLLGAGKVSGASEDAATTAWVNAVITAGGTVGTTQRGYVNTLIVSLKAASLWTKLDRLWLYASENITQAKVDLSANASHTVTGPPSFTASQGYTADGSSYIDTGANMVSVAGNYSTNSACYGFYHRTSIDINAAANIQMGCRDTGNAHISSYQNTGGDNNIYARINDTFTGSPTPQVTAVGLNILTRTSSSAEKLYQFLSTGNVSYTMSNSVTDVPNTNFYVMALNNASGGSPSAAFICQAGEFSISFLGGGLTDPDAASLSSCLNAYMTSLGKNVY